MIVPGEPTKLAEQPWWSEADAAQLDASVYALVDRYYGDTGSPDLPEALDLVVRWRNLAAYVARARYLSE